MLHNKNIKVTKHSLYQFLTVIVVAYLGFLLGPLYVNNDQFIYRDLYASVKNLSFSNGFEYYKLHVGSQEPVYYTLVWISSNLNINKDIFTGVANLILAYSSYKILTKLGALPVIAFLIVSANFYFFVFYFAAERLKFAALFFALGVLSKRYRYLLFLLAILSHSQIIVLLVCLLAPQLKNIAYNILFKFRLKKTYIWSLLSVFFISITTFIALSSHIINKISAYHEKFNGFFDFFKLLILLLLSLNYSHNKSNVFYSFLPLLLLIPLVGQDRINLIAYFLFLFFSIRSRGGLNIGIVITLIYFCFTAFIFAMNIVHYGEGFNIR